MLPKIKTEVDQVENVISKIKRSFSEKQIWPKLKRKESLKLCTLKMQKGPLLV